MTAIDEVSGVSEPERRVAKCVNLSLTAIKSWKLAFFAPSNAIDLSNFPAKGDTLALATMLTIVGRRAGMKRASKNVCA